MGVSAEVTPVVERNDHIREYLEYYVSFPHPPRFAVLLNGPWGIGKTFLIKKLLSQYFSGEKDKYVYVSLYGLGSIEEIDEALMAAIYPALGWKGMKIAGRVVKSALKYGGIETDLRPADFLSKYKAKLYVFDDLERCEVKPINKVLGYINEFVEHDDCKVVIIANEKEIPDSAEYVKRREKLIGKTLEVQSSFEDALVHFTSLIDDSASRLFIGGKTENITTIYHQSQLHNLRILQQTLWDFERIYKVLSSKHRENSEAMTSLFSMIFALSFEVKSGRLEAKDLASRMSGFLAAMVGAKKDAEPSSFQIAVARYQGIDLDDSMLSDELLVDILFRGVMHGGDIGESLGRSPHFVKPGDEPAWRTVWFGVERTDEDFSRAFAELERQFSERSFVIIGEILHVFGLRLWLSDIGVLSKTRGEVALECKKYVDDLYAQKRLDAIPTLDSHDFRSEGYGGLGIHNEAPEYRELFTYLKEKRFQVGLDSHPAQAAELLNEMAKDPSLYYRRLCLTNSEENIYHRVPILASVDPSIFVDLLLKQTPTHQRIIFSAFEGRYEHGRLERDLLAERAWLGEVHERLIEAMSKMSAIGKYRFKKFIEWDIEPFLPAKPEGSETNSEG